MKMKFRDYLKKIKILVFVVNVIRRLIKLPKRLLLVSIALLKEIILNKEELILRHDSSFSAILSLQLDMQGFSMKKHFVDP
jgi:hypothetical protein